MTKEEETLIFSDNPSRFIFNNKKIPDTYINFLKSKSPEALTLIPDYVIEKETDYYVE